MDFAADVSPESAGAESRALGAAEKAALRRGLAVCFCGGRSERMGEDKALLVGDWAAADSLREPLRVPFRGTLLAHGLKRLEALACAEIVLASGAGPPRYPQFGKRELVDWPLDSAGDSGAQQQKSAGPLAGLAAALEEARALDLDWIFVLACDLPRVPVETMRDLVHHALDASADVCLAATEETVDSERSLDSHRVHPLFAFYSVRCLEPVLKALEAGKRRMIAFHDNEFAALTADARSLQIETYPVPAGQTTNLNTPLDYERERKAATLVPSERENGTS